MHPFNAYLLPVDLFPACFRRPAVSCTRVSHPTHATRLAAALILSLVVSGGLLSPANAADPDDATVDRINTPGPQLPEIDATAPGNHLRNPSFEVGTDGWRVYTERTLEGGGTVVKVEDAVDGDRVLRLVAPPANGSKPAPAVGLVSVFTPLEGEVGTASVYARAVEGQPRLTMKLQDSRVEETFELTSEWQRYRLTADLNLPEPYERLAMQFHGRGTVEIDAVEFEAAAEPTEFDAPARPELGLQTSLDVALLHPDETARLGFSAQLPDQPLAGDSSNRWTVTWTCTDHAGNEWHRTDITVEGDSTAHATTWQAPDAYGWYQWRATLKHNGRPVLSRRYQLGVTPPQPASRNPMFSGTITFTDIAKNVKKAKRLGLFAVRFHGVLLQHHMWAYRDNPGQWPTDAWIDHICDTGIRPYVYLIDHHTKLSRRIMKSETLTGLYERFVTAMTRRYRGKMYAYMVWNEPEFKVEPEVYAFFHDRIAGIVRDNAPEAAVVGLSSVHARRDWTRRVIDATDGEIGDIASIHCYLNGQPPERLLATRIDGLLGADRSYLREAGRADMPVWDTESGYFLDEDNRPRRRRTPDFYWKTPLKQAQYNVRQNLMSFALGLAQKNTFLLVSVNWDMWQRHSLFRPDNLESARPSAVAYAVMAAALGPAEPVGLHWTGRDGIYAYEFRDSGDDRPLWVVWSAGDSRTLTLSGAGPVEARNMFGRVILDEAASRPQDIAVTGSPVYLRFDRDIDLPRHLDATFRPFGRKPPRAERQAEAREEAWPVKPTQIITAAEVEFFRWEPGLVATTGRAGGRPVLRLERPAGDQPADALAKFQVVLPKDQAGRYDIWAAVEPMFPTESTKLQLKANDRTLPVPRGLDQPMTYDVVTESGKTHTLAWEFLGSARLSEGANDLVLLPVAGDAQAGAETKQTWRQTCDRLLLHRKNQNGKRTPHENP